MAEFTFFTHPMSRGQIARWALHETGADHEQVLVDWQARPATLLAANPMGKVPVIVHHSPHGDKVVSEAAAICHYLAEMHPGSGLLPADDEMADYFRWMFFAAGPGEQAIAARSLGFDPVDARQQGMAGWGSFDRTFSTLEWWMGDRDFVGGNRFTMADVYVGSLIDWGLNFGLVPPNEAFVGYVERIQSREGYKSAKAIDGKLIGEARK